MKRFNDFNELTITLTGKAGTVRNCKDKSQLDGVDCQDNFSEYFDRDASYADCVKGGYMQFKYRNGELYTVVKYRSTRKLTEEELADLIDYTQGQLSDGIGEGFEQYPCYEDEDGKEVYVSPWYYGQVLTATQE